MCCAKKGNARNVTAKKPNRYAYPHNAVSLLGTYGTEIWYGTELFVRTYPRARFHVTVTSVSVAHALRDHANMLTTWRRGEGSGRCCEML